MRRVIYFNEKAQQANYCCKTDYCAFLDYALCKTDYFMLVYKNFYGKGYGKNQEDIKQALAKFQIKKRTDPKWPGVPFTNASNTTYQIVFYKNCPEAFEILKIVEKISDWNSPMFPSDLAFFVGNRCWFYSVGHEKIAAIIDASEEDIMFVEKNGFACREDIINYDGDYFNQFDECTLGQVDDTLIQP